MIERKCNRVNRQTCREIINSETFSTCLKETGWEILTFQETFIIFKYFLLGQQLKNSFEQKNSNEQENLNITQESSDKYDYNLPIPFGKQEYDPNFSEYVI